MAAHCSIHRTNCSGLILCANSAVAMSWNRSMLRLPNSSFPKPFLTRVCANSANCPVCRCMLACTSPMSLASRNPASFPRSNSPLHRSCACVSAKLDLVLLILTTAICAAFVDDSMSCSWSCAVATPLRASTASVPNIRTASHKSAPVVVLKASTGAACARAASSALVKCSAACSMRSAASCTLLKCEASCRPAPHKLPVRPDERRYTTDSRRIRLSRSRPLFIAAGWKRLSPALM
mmetsp:Transcript_9978/g.15791  ORF Transcript_9978/g.15791 Transcript_9978/m.15791 type:complete len:236 (-) Transcript_9978:630-1337(-)